MISVMGLGLRYLVAMLLKWCYCSLSDSLETYTGPRYYWRLDWHEEVDWRYSWLMVM